MPKQKQNSPETTAPAENIQLMSVPDVARKCDVSVKTAWRWIYDRKLSFYRLNRRVAVSAQQLQQFLTGAEVPAIDAKQLAQQILGEV